MKVRLERTLSSCRATLTCTACELGFNANRIRNLLCSNDGQIHGDLCPSCVKAGEKGIRAKIKEKALRTLQQSSLQTDAIEAYRQGLINLELAESPITMPKFYERWLKEFEILSQETQELEKARLALSGCQCGKSKNKLRIVFQTDTNLNE